MSPRAVLHHTDANLCTILHKTVRPNVHLPYSAADARSLMRLYVPTRRPDLDADGARNQCRAAARPGSKASSPQARAARLYSLAACVHARWLAASLVVTGVR